MHNVAQWMAIIFGAVFFAMVGAQLLAKRKLSVKPRAKPQSH